MRISEVLKLNKNIHWSISEKIIVFQLIFILFERYFIQLGAPNAIIYVLDLANVYLFLDLAIQRNNKRFSILIMLYIVFVGVSLGIAISNYCVYGNNIVFSILEIRNIIRFLIFFLAVVRYLKVEHIDFIFSVVELHFIINSFFIIFLYFTYFPPTASWMRGDILNGFFGNMRGGNTFVNVEMLVIVLYIFIKWTKKEEKLMHLLGVLSLSIVVAGLIELKAYFIEIALVYIWYLIFVKKRLKELKLNIIIITFAIAISYIAIQIMLREYPWFEHILSINGLLEQISSINYSSADDLNRFTGVFTISDKMFNGNLLEILFGIGLGNGAVSEIAGRTTAFASKYVNSNYSWFSGTYVFVQCGLVGLLIYLGTFVYLFMTRKTNIYKTYSNMIIILSVFLVFYGEALKTDAGYLLYFAIATGFLKFRKNKDGLGCKDAIDNYNTSLQCGKIS